MRRPPPAGEALGLSPLVEARRADSSAVESVPVVAAATRPVVVLARRPAAKWTLDARVRTGQGSFLDRGRDPEQQMTWWGHPRGRTCLISGLAPFANSTEKARRTAG